MGEQTIKKKEKKRKEGRGKVERLVLEKWRQTIISDLPDGFWRPVWRRGLWFTVDVCWPIHHMSVFTLAWPSSLECLLSSSIQQSFWSSPIIMRYAIIVA